MSIADPIPDGTLCSECGSHRATVKFCNDNMMGWIHGGWTVICACCQLKLQREHVEGATKLLEELERKPGVLDCS